MARVNVEDQSLRDPRFKRLGKLLAPKLPVARQRRLAFGTLLDIWDYMTEKFVAPPKASREDPEPAADPRYYRLSRATLEDITDEPGIGDFLVASDLAELHQESGELRLKGTLGRIEWLGRSRRNGNKGGRPPKHPAPETPREYGTGSEPEANRKRTGSEPEANPKLTYPTPDPTPDLDPPKRSPLTPQGGNGTGPFKPNGRMALMDVRSATARVLRKRGIAPPTDYPRSTSDKLQGLADNGTRVRDIADEWARRLERYLDADAKTFTQATGRPQRPAFPDLELFVRTFDQWDASGGEDERPPEADGYHYARPD